MNATQAYKKVDEFGVDFSFATPSDFEQAKKDRYDFDFTGARIHIKWKGLSGTHSFPLNSREEAAFTVLVLDLKKEYETWNLSQETSFHLRGDDTLELQS